MICIVNKQPPFVIIPDSESFQLLDETIVQNESSTKIYPVTSPCSPITPLYAVFQKTQVMEKKGNEPKVLAATPVPIVLQAPIITKVSCSPFSSEHCILSFDEQSLYEEKTARTTKNRDFDKQGYEIIERNTKFGWCSFQIVQGRKVQQQMYRCLSCNDNPIVCYACFEHEHKSHNTENMGQVVGSCACGSGAITESPCELLVAHKVPSTNLCLQAFTLLQPDQFAFYKGAIDTPEKLPLYVVYNCCYIISETC